jgi:hypothetical protein
LKRKIKFTKEFKTKTKIKRIRIKFEKKNQDYGSNDEIENKLNFYKIAKNQNKKSKH